MLHVKRGWIPLGKKMKGKDEVVRGGEAELKKYRNGNEERDSSLRKRVSWCIGDPCIGSVQLRLLQPASAASAARASRGAARLARRCLRAGVSVVT